MVPPGVINMLLEEKWVALTGWYIFEQAAEILRATITVDNVSWFN
jgi:hypothetical protein